MTNSAIERLLSLRVKDIMQTDVVTIEESDDLRVAASKLATAEVTGAPVVDATGRCVGVISGSDFIVREAHEGPPSILVRPTDESPYHISSLNENLVAGRMCRDVVAIAPEATVVQAARKLCEHHIHRLIVLDAERHPVGVLSSLDLVATLVAAVEE